jgi:hypothetical protein
MAMTIEQRLNRIEARIERHLKPPFPPDLDDLTARVEGLTQRVRGIESDLAKHTDGFVVALDELTARHDRELAALRDMVEGTDRYVREQQAQFFAPTPPAAPIREADWMPPNSESYDDIVSEYLGPPDDAANACNHSFEYEMSNRCRFCGLTQKEIDREEQIIQLGVHLTPEVAGGIRTMTDKAGMSLSEMVRDNAAQDDKRFLGSVIKAIQDAEKQSQERGDLNGHVYKAQAAIRAVLDWQASIGLVTAPEEGRRWLDVPEIDESLVTLVFNAGAVRSKGEARRLIAQGGVKVEGDVLHVGKRTYPIPTADAEGEVTGE